MMMSYDQRRVTPRDRAMHGKRWKGLEMEEQARARALIRCGLATIQGTDVDRIFVLHAA